MCVMEMRQEINLLLSFSKKIKKQKILFFCYLMANNQVKCGITYERKSRSGWDNGRIMNYEWP